MRRRDAQSGHRRDATRDRAGFLAPAVAVALVAVLLALALVLDVWWLENATVEMDAAVEGSALAAGRALVSDDLLRPDPDRTAAARIDRARQAAVELATRQRVAGRPVRLHPQRDVRFGHLHWNADGTAVFHGSDNRPSTVVVTVRRTRRNGNPVALFLRGISGASTADLARRAEASVDNCVIGVRPLPDGPIPMWPLAIAEIPGQNAGGSPARLDNWREQIEQRLGRDDFGWDATTKTVRRIPDGIPEMILRCNDPSNTMTNVCVVDLGSGLNVNRLQQQFRGGVIARDLRSFGGQLRIDAQPLTLNASAGVPTAIRNAWTSAVGACRVVLLYRQRSTPGVNGLSRLQCARLVAGRVMAVRMNAGVCEIVFQPGTLVTRTALLADRRLPQKQRNTYRNPCIYKLQLTN